jgi:VIT1/CCC1 family predicted Fe2+/Mn2+ transporter
MVSMVTIWQQVQRRQQMRGNVSESAVRQGANAMPAAANPQELTDEQNFVLRVVQPALTGLMDGSVSTLAPIFASAFATGKPHIAFLIGLSAAVGAGISMAFAEGLSDDGVLTGRGHPVIRGAITGIATFIGGVMHTLPFLLPHLNAALYLAYLVVGVELIAIAYIRYRYFKMNFILSALQVIVGGALVFGAGILIGSA